MKRRSVRSKRTQRNIRRSVRSKRTQRKSFRKQKKTNMRRNVRSKRVKNVRKMKSGKKSVQKGGNNCGKKLKRCKIENTELKKLNNKLTKDYLSKQHDLLESVGDIKTMYTNLRDRRQSLGEILNDWESRVPMKKKTFEK